MPRALRSGCIVPTDPTATAASKRSHSSAVLPTPKSLARAFSLVLVLLSLPVCPRSASAFRASSAASSMTASGTAPLSAAAASAVAQVAPATANLNIPLETLAAQANSFASARGIQVERRRTDNDVSYFECAPMSLLPNAYPETAFAKAQTLASPFNALVDRISRDAEFLHQTLGGGVSDADSYTAKLLRMYKDIYVEAKAPGSKFAQSADRLGIHRSDYMLHGDGKDGKGFQLKQVELNTIAASFAGLSTNIADLHRYLTQRFASETNEFLKNNRKIVSVVEDGVSPAEGVPKNPALERIPYAMSVAHRRYLDRFLTPEASNTAVLFVVQDGEINTVDQRMLEFRLWEDHNIPVVRMSLARANEAIRVDDNTGALKIKETDTEISVVYYRAGYAPTDYPQGEDGAEWSARAMLESSRATKAPSLGYHLAGTKKVQQELARPGVLERFFPGDDDSVVNLRSAFAGLYSLGEDATFEDLQAVRDALSGQHGQYVLKPQREGGGYNFYGEKLAVKLRENSTIDEDTGDISLDKRLGEYILMQRLFPPQQRAVLLRSGRVEGSGESVSELGCYGALVVSPDGEIVHNEYAGFLLRTKFSNVDEGGVASGFATLSSPYLC